MSATTYDFMHRKHDAVEELLLLIQGLSSAEKSHCRQRFREKQETSYLKLFEFAIRNDDPKAVFKKAKDISDKPASAFSRKLTNTIVDSLKGFHAKIDEENEMLQSLQELRYLAEKRLYKLCLKRLKKLKQRAYQLQIYEIVLRLIKLQREITFFSPKEVKESHQLVEEANEVEQFIRNETTARSIASEAAQILYASGLSAREKNKSNIIGLETELSQLKNAEQLSLRAITNIHIGISNINIIKKDYEQAFHPFRKIIDAFELHPQLKKVRIKKFVQVLVNYINRMVSAGLCQSESDLSYVRSIIEDTKSGFKIDLDDKQYLDATLYHALYSIHLEKWDLEKALKAAEKMKACEIPLNRNKALNSIFQYELAQVHFYVGEYEKCVDFIDRFLNANGKNIFPDLYLFSRILFLFVLTEQGNTLGFFNQFDATRKAVDSAPHQVLYEKAIMKMLLHFNKAESPTARQAVLQILESDLQAIQELTGMPFMFFRIKRWLSSKREQPVAQ